jgi:protein dithiol:quinone oxidoreductase
LTDSGCRLASADFSMLKMTLIRRLWLALAVVAAGIAGGSLVLTAWLSLHPCHLCIFQRLLFMLIAPGALVSAWRPNVVSGGLVALFSGAGLAAATYQTWLQAQPPGSVACSSGEPDLIERLVEWLGNQSPDLFLATGFCEDKELEILGLSLANAAMLGFAAALGSALWLLWQGNFRKEST